MPLNNNPPTNFRSLKDFGSLLVNLHTHTLFSDGELTPEALAANLANAGVRYVALTDHDTLESLPRFEAALNKCGLAYLPGLELTTWHVGRELHLLAYGFDPAHPDLGATLVSMRQVRELEVQSIAGSLSEEGHKPAQRQAGCPRCQRGPGWATGYRGRHRPGSSRGGQGFLGTSADV